MILALCLLAGYFTIGLGLGVWIVWNNLARFHGGGFQWKRMAWHIGKIMLLWPVAMLEMILLKDTKP